MLALAAGVTATQALGSQEPVQQPPARQARTHTVVRGDNLWDLSQTYLGNPFLWPEIYRINRDVVEDPHWIYPGELLRLPGDSIPAIAQLPESPQGITGQAPVAPGAPTGEVARPVNPNEPTIFTRSDQGMATGPVGGFGVIGVVNESVRPTVRAGEALMAPFVDREGGPRGFGRIIKSADVAGVAQASERFRFQAYDRVLIDPPVGHVAPEGEKYLSVRLGPKLEDQGQVVIPTGVFEVVKSARSETGAIAKVVRAFGDISGSDRLIPIDTAGVGTTVRPVPVADGPSTKITWIHGDPVLPSLQNFIIFDVSSRNGVRLGDEFVIYLPAPKAQEGQPREREALIAKAQVVRTTPYGATAIIIGQEQPSIKTGLTARVTAKMP